MIACSRLQKVPRVGNVGANNLKGARSRLHCALGFGHSDCDLCLAVAPSNQPFLCGGRERGGGRIVASPTHTYIYQYRVGSW